MSRTAAVATKARKRALSRTPVARGVPRSSARRQGQEFKRRKLRTCPPTSCRGRSGPLKPTRRGTAATVAAAMPVGRDARTGMREVQVGSVPHEAFEQGQWQSQPSRDCFSCLYDRVGRDKSSEGTIESTRSSVQSDKKSGHTSATSAKEAMPT